MRRLWSALVLSGLTLSSAANGAASPSDRRGRSDAMPEFAVNAVTVATPGRDDTPPSTLCVVWADAEGLGVGPAQLNDLHGLSLTLNLAPTGGTTLEQALASAKATYPKVPDWLLAAVRGRAGGIAKACAATHAEPALIGKLTASERR